MPVSRQSGCFPLYCVCFLPHTLICVPECYVDVMIGYRMPYKICGSCAYPLPITHRCSSFQFDGLLHRSLIWLMPDLWMHAF